MINDEHKQQLEKKDRRKEVTYEQRTPHVDESVRSNA